MNTQNIRIKWARLAMVTTGAIFTLILAFVLGTVFSRTSASGRFTWNAPDSIQPVENRAP